MTTRTNPRLGGASLPAGPRHRGRLAVAGRLLLATAGCLWLPIAAAQVEQESLPPDGATVTPIEVTALPSRSGEEVRALFDRALAVFRSVDQADSIALFDELIAVLEESESTAIEGWRELLSESLFHRAEAHFNLGERPAASADLRAALTSFPGFEPDLGQVSPKLAELFRSVRDEVTAGLLLRVEPADAEVRLDGEPVPVNSSGQPLRLLAGPHHLEVVRPGYAVAEEQLELAPGKVETRNVALERTSATILVTTTAPGAEVEVDGRAAGVTALPAARPAAPPTGPAAGGIAVEGEAEPAAPAAPEPVAPGLAVLAVPGLELGEHRLAVGRAGFRTYQGTVRIAERIDYRVGPITLEPTGGTLRLSQLPAAGDLSVDGARRAGPPGETGELTLELPVGPHRVEVARGTLGGYAASFDLADRQTVDLEVILRPRLCLLDVLGGDLDAAERMRAGLIGSLRERGEWLGLDRTEEADPVLADLGLTAAGLRAALTTGTIGGAADWAELQRRADRTLACSAYALGVLSDDLYASQADLWVLAAGPGPQRPELLRLRLEDAASYAEAAGRLGERAALSRPWLGADLLPAAEGAVVYRVTDGGPAARAGLRVGDVVLAALGPEGEVEAPATGGPAHFEVLRDGTRVAVAVEPGSGPRVLDPRRHDVFLPAAAAWWALAEAEGRAPAWVVGLDRAAAEMRLGDWRSAVRTLRGLDAPARPGLGRGALDYWLGVALLAVDPAAYREEARAAFSRAAAAPGARLFHDDGPEVAPRARLRLAGLDAR